MQLSTTQIAVIAVVCVVAVGGGAFFVLNSGGEDNNFEINDIPNLSKVYDGKAVSYAPSLSEGSADLSVTWFSGDVELTSAPVNAGHYKIEVKGENGKITKTKEAEFDIAKAQFELTVDNASAYNKIYDTLAFLCL